MIVESLTFTTGSVHDSKMAQKLTKDIIGKAFANREKAGILSARIKSWKTPE